MDNFMRERNSTSFTSFETICKPMLDRQAGYGGNSITVPYVSRKQRSHAAAMVNGYAVASNAMVLQITELFQGQYGASKTIFASCFMEELPHLHPSIDAIKVTVLSPYELAAIAPRGFSSRGVYRSVGELLHIGPEGLVEKGMGVKRWIKYCVSHSNSGQALLGVLTLASKARFRPTKTFGLATYSEPSGDGTYKPKFTTIYLQDGYTEDDFYQELDYLLAVVVRPA